MTQPMTAPLSDLLRHWRSLRRMSQYDLALAAGISARHMSFVETGRSQPSRDVVWFLAGALGMPARERNLLLQAAGYAPDHSVTSLESPEMGEVREALRLVLRRQEPFGAIVLDRHWDILMANEAMRRFVLAAGQNAPMAYELSGPPRTNWLRTLLAPGPVRTVIANWREVAEAVLVRVRRELWSDPEREALYREVTAYPDVPKPGPRLLAEPLLLIPVRLRLGQHEVRLFGTLGSLGTAQDVTLQELKIEAFHPFDAEALGAERADKSTGAGRRS
jgi:transcriptional regulator with XRE-family HTH domain